MIPYAHSFDCDCQSLSFDSWVGYLVTPHLHWNHNYHPRHHPRRTLIHFLLSGCSQSKPFWVGLSTHDMNTNTTSAAISFNTTLLKRSHTTPSEKKRMCLRTAIWLAKSNWSYVSESVPSCSTMLSHTFRKSSEHWTELQLKREILLRTYYMTEEYK